MSGCGRSPRMVLCHELAKWGAVVTLGPEENERRKRFIGTQRAFGSRKRLVTRRRDPWTSDTASPQQLGSEKAGGATPQPCSLLLSDFLPALSIGSASPEPTGHGAVMAGHAGQPPRAQGSVETSRPRKHPTQQAATVTAVGAEGKSWRDDSLVKSSLSHSRGEGERYFPGHRANEWQVLVPESSGTLVFGHQTPCICHYTPLLFLT